MEWVIFFSVIFLIVLAVFIRGAIQERKSYKKFCISLKEQFGKTAGQEYSTTDMERVAKYHDKMIALGRAEGFTLDDITWNDLNMDEIFMQINTTQSSIGEEYLYHRLRCPEYAKKDSSSWNTLVDFFRDDEDKRIEVQKCMHTLGKISKFSITDIIYLLMNVKRESNLIHYCMDIALALSACVIFIYPGIGVLLFLAVLAYAIISYFNRKSEVSPYFTTFYYIINMLQVSDRIKKMNEPVFSEFVNKLEKASKMFGNFRKHTYVLSTGTHTIDNPLELVMDYARMILHIDIIKFNSMLKIVQNRSGEIEILREILGRFDAAVAVASYSVFLPYYCEPQFEKKESAFLDVCDVYHPLVESFVANSICTETGVLVTGSNASGKSTFLKTIAVSSVLGQTIGIVPARSYHADFFRIYSSMALRDSLKTKESYYMVEIRSLKRILDAGEQEQPLLCFVDEVLRGTNTVERIAASSQILKSLHKKHVLCFAATHDVELTHLLETDFDNYHFNEEVRENDVVFSYHLHKGRAESRNAIKLLSIMGYEQEIIKSAENTAECFLETGNWTLS